VVPRRPALLRLPPGARRDRVVARSILAGVLLAGAPIYALLFILQS
jgi:hypothetical protein